MSNIVPNEIPEGCKLLCIGESPGEWEDRLKRPFVSVDVAQKAGFTLDTNTAGELLERYLGRLNLRREDVGFANLYKRRPPGNKFETILQDPYLKTSLKELSEDIQRAKPNCILALGGFPLWFLTGRAGKDKGKVRPGSGITTYRGSRYHSTLKGCEGIKVYPTFHPAYILRNWKMNPIFFHDLSEAVKDSQFPELKYPSYEEHINPDSDKLYDLTHAALSSDWVSVDIETFPGGRYSCVGFSFRKREDQNGGSGLDGIQQGDIGVCITYQRSDLARFAREVWESNTPKIFQFGTYDINFMKTFCSWRIGGYYDGVGWDTYIASASLLPDYPRGLDFLTSIYTRFPFYKHERKVWKEVGDMNILWKYNIKDCISTYQIAMEQMKGIKDLFHG